MRTIYERTETFSFSGFLRKICAKAVSLKAVSLIFRAEGENQRMTETFYTQEAWEQAAKALEAISSQEYLVTPSVTPVENLPRKVYKCPTKNCSKKYKNSNGLKYHLEKGTCVASRDGSPDSSPSIQHLDKPFYCKLGCVKYYRNINGLKYHARIEHGELDFEKDVKGVVMCTSFANTLG